jgi:hypothetical protein
MYSFKMLQTFMVLLLTSESYKIKLYPFVAFENVEVL